MKKDTGPSLFDDTDDDDAGLPPNDWKEVPAALFDSWSLSRQLGYCRDRDINAAIYATNDEDATFHKTRADMYAKEMRDARAVVTTL